MQVRELAPGATCDPAGYWRVPDAPAVAYPEMGHEFCAGVEDRSLWFAQRNRVIGKAVCRYPPRGGPLLDLGAGNGYVAAMLERSGFSIVAIEPSADGAARCVRRGVTHVIHGALPSPAFRHGVAGGIALFDVIEHIENDQQWLTTLRPYLKPAGRLYVTTPAYQWLWSNVDEASGHYRRYTLKRLQNVVQRAGYELDYATYVFWCLPPVMYVLRGFTRSRDPLRSGMRRTEHTIGGAFARSMASVLFAGEAGLVARGIRIPFGASCLLVAHRAP